VRRGRPAPAMCVVYVTPVRLASAIAARISLPRIITPALLAKRLGVRLQRLPPSNRDKYRDGAYARTKVVAAATALQGYSMPNEYDVVIVGAGHNGLVTAGYLARAGLRTLVLESRDVVGGSCVTEEIFPGYKILHHVVSVQPAAGESYARSGAREIWARGLPQGPGVLQSLS